MKPFNKIVMVFALFFTSFCSSLLVLGCEKSSESAPFFDGLYLKYHEVFGNPQKPKETIWTREIEYRFKQLKNGGFVVSQKVKTQKGKRLDKKLPIPPYPQVGEDLTVDKKGIVLKGGDNFNFPKGYPSYLWLPRDKSKEGAEVIEVIRKVGKKTKWEGWEVWPVKGMLGDMHYYDANTGILVGVENLKSKLKMTLMDTNLEVLKIALSNSIDK